MLESEEKDTKGFFGEDADTFDFGNTSQTMSFTMLMGYSWMQNLPKLLGD